MQLAVDRPAASDEAIPGVLDPRRGLSAGILSAVERHARRRHGIGLA
jgi:hypothetical protein